MKGIVHEKKTWVVWGFEEKAQNPRLGKTQYTIKYVSAPKTYPFTPILHEFDTLFTLRTYSARLWKKYLFYVNLWTRLIYSAAPPPPPGDFRYVTNLNFRRHESHFMEMYAAVGCQRDFRFFFCVATQLIAQICLVSLATNSGSYVHTFPWNEWDSCLLKLRLVRSDRKGLWTESRELYMLVT